MPRLGQMTRVITRTSLLALRCITIRILAVEIERVSRSWLHSEAIPVSKNAFRPKMVVSFRGIPFVWIPLDHDARVNFRFLVAPGRIGFTHHQAFVVSIHIFGYESRDLL